MKIFLNILMRIFFPWLILSSWGDFLGFFMYIFLNMYFLFPGILPVCPLKTHFHCPVDGSGNKACISRAQLCDFTNDCWDGSDEINCQNYTRCDFNDTNICGWLQAKNDQMDWTRHKGNTPSIFTGNLRCEKNVRLGVFFLRAPRLAWKWPFALC